ncbi:MAG: hypothetical protein GY754_22235 [bacterium]|nr:hypothetical protein [bacterium]
MEMCSVCSLDKSTEKYSCYAAKSAKDKIYEINEAPKQYNICNDCVAREEKKNRISAIRTLCFSVSIMILLLVCFFNIGDKNSPDILFPILAILPCLFFIYLSIVSIFFPPGKKQEGYSLAKKLLSKEIVGNWAREQLEGIKEGHRVGNENLLKDMLKKTENNTIGFNDFRIKNKADIIVKGKIVSDADVEQMKKKNRVRIRIASQ